MAAAAEEEEEEEAGGIFQAASREFEDSERDGEGLDPEGEDHGAPQPQEPQEPGAAEEEPQRASRAEGPAEGPRASEVSLAVGDLKGLMGRFGLGLEDAAQAFLKNSGETAAAEGCLRTGRRPDGRPLWTRQDDAELMKGDQALRSRLVARYGAENVEKREAFRRS